MNNERSRGNSIMKYDEAVMMNYAVSKFQSAIKPNLYQLSNECYNNCYDKMNNFMEKVDTFVYKNFLKKNI